LRRLISKRDATPRRLLRASSPRAQKQSILRHLDHMGKGGQEKKKGGARSLGEILKKRKPLVENPRAFPSPLPNLSGDQHFGRGCKKRGEVGVELPRSARHKAGGERLYKEAPRVSERVPFIKVTKGRSERTRDKKGKRKSRWGNYLQKRNITDPDKGTENLKQGWERHRPAVLIKAER